MRRFFAVALYQIMSAVALLIVAPILLLFALVLGSAKAWEWTVLHGAYGGDVALLKKDRWRCH